MNRPGIRYVYRQFSRPRWSLKTSFFTGLALLIVVTILVLILVHKSIWNELEIVTLAISALLFAYLTTVLYLGVRFDKRERFEVVWPRGNLGDFADAVSIAPVDTGGFFTEMGTDEGCAGLAIGFLLDLIASTVLVFLVAILLWAGVNGLIAVIFAVCLPLFHFYRRALRAIAVKGRTCRGNLLRSMAFALKSTVLYTLWFYTIFMLAHHAQKIWAR